MGKSEYIKHILHKKTPHVNVCICVIAVSNPSFCKKKSVGKNNFGRQL